MITVEIDTTGLREIKAAIDQIEDRRYNSIKSAAHYANVLMKDRISKGMNAKGQMMESKSKRKEGRYSKQWGKKRSAKGKRTDIVNLSYSGDTMQDFGVDSSRQDFMETAASLNFKNSESEQIGEWNNEMFGNAYDLSNNEIDDVFNDYIDEFGNNILLK